MTPADYRFDRFQRRFIAEDMAFAGGRAPGEAFPDFQLETVDGRTLSRNDFIEKQPLLVIFSSFT